MTKQERKKYITYIKARNPIGTEIWDHTRSQPFVVRKNSVFDVREFEYNEESKPEKESDHWLDFLVRDPGKHTSWYTIEDPFFTTKGDVDKYLISRQIKI